MTDETNTADPFQKPRCEWDLEDYKRALDITETQLAATRADYRAKRKAYSKRMRAIHLEAITALEVERWKKRALAVEKELQHCQHHSVERLNEVLRDKADALAAMDILEKKSIPKMDCTGCFTSVGKGIGCTPIVPLNGRLRPDDMYWRFSLPENRSLLFKFFHWQEGADFRGVDLENQRCLFIFQVSGLPVYVRFRSGSTTPVYLHLGDEWRRRDHGITQPELKKLQAVLVTAQASLHMHIPHRSCHGIHPVVPREQTEDSQPHGADRDHNPLVPGGCDPSLAERERLPDG